MLLKTLPDDHEDICEIYHQIGNAFYTKNEIDLALDMYIRAYHLRQQMLPENHLKLGRSLNSIGSVYYRKGDFDQAFNYFNKALNIFHINNDNNTGTLTELIGLIFRRKKQYDSALECFKTTLEIRQKTFPKGHPRIAWCLGQIGLIYEEQFKYDQALDYYHSALKVQEKILPNGQQTLIISGIERIIRVYKLKNAYNEAVNFCQQKLLIEDNDSFKYTYLVKTIETLLVEKDCKQTINEIIDKL
ncbi:unnamed protein product [Didymodactylos carnosus]|uniref:Kinesin light chain n=1 Tax=Didymodactylos carnosus TaxID=1234261 RepID=A0A8S2DYJ6_9BILA|nr:unnamed protein product [Didymodactylos carnosus]CAF3769618.1 unnamed protein product [Didymodactylos carnosus]